MRVGYALHWVGHEESRPDHRATITHPRGPWDDMQVACPGTWHRRAACANASVEFTDLERYSTWRAIALCRVCQVKEECLAEAVRLEALPGGQSFGIRGGLMAHQRGHLVHEAREKVQCTT